jgi:hypothetical protein
VDSDTDRDSDRHLYADGDGNVHTNGNGNVHADGDGNRDRYADADPITDRDRAGRDVRL